MEQKPEADEISASMSDQESALDIPNPKWITSTLPAEQGDGSLGVETLHCQDDSGGVFTDDDNFAFSNDGMSELSDISLTEVCISSNTKLVKEEMNYEVQQAYRIFSEFLMEKHKVTTSPFLTPVVNEDEETQHGFGGVRSRRSDSVRHSMCLRRMEEKFIHQEYDTITEFVGDFRLMLENCYRFHGVDHWLSKQAQKLEIMLEQKLTLLSRKLREKTTLVVTSKGRFGVEEERASSSSTRRRQTRSVKTLNVGGHESIMVQTLRVEEQQRTKEEKRQRELEKKEAEEMSAKEMDEWEQNLLSQALPHNVETIWELPAIGHFLCLAQTALNLPEIVFFELERCLLMPRCSIFLSKIMSSLLCPPQRRSTLHRRPVLPYRRWESELRQKVKGWYHSVGSSHDQTARAELLGLCHQFFTVLGESSPLEAKAFHVLPFYQRVWLLKGLCDHVYETQRDIQIAVLAQPIHECRESILGYDSKENAYIHFPHFCGADLRIYCQSPCTSPNFPFPPVLVKRVEILDKKEEMPFIIKNTSEDFRTTFEETIVKAQMSAKCKMGTTDGDDVDRCQFMAQKTTEHFERSNDEDCSDESKVEPHIGASTAKGPIRKRILTEKKSEFDLESKRLKTEMNDLCSFHINEACRDEEHCYTGSPLQILRTASGSVILRDQRTCKNKIGDVKPEHRQYCLSSEDSNTAYEEKDNDKILTKTKKWKKKKTRDHLLNVKPEPPEAPNKCSDLKRKSTKRKHTEALSKKIKNEPPAGPSFKLICTNLDELRELINKTEDELDDLESTKKKMNRWYCRKEAVKDLHSTLVRLLNELTPWEPKLIKAYQRNRLRLKKEFEVFRSHPEYSNFVREESISSSSSSSSSSDDEDARLGLLFEQSSQTGHENPEHILPRGLGGNIMDLSTELSTDTPVTPVSYNFQTQALTSSTCVKLDSFNKNTCQPELNNHSVKSSLLWSSPKLSNVHLQNSPFIQSNIHHTSSGQPKNYTPIPTLLAKSVGNKVTLMKQPADHLEIDSINGDGKGTVVSTGDTNLLNNSSSPSLNSQQKHDVFYTVHKESTNLVGNSNSTLRCEERKPQQVVFLPPNIHHNMDKKVTMLQQQFKDVIQSNINMDNTFCLSTNVAGFTIPENGILQQVPPSKDSGLLETSLCSSNIPSFFKSQPRTVCSAKSKCDVPTTTPQCTLNITSVPVSLSKATDSKQELKTVCIRESQSILVTTRGGNTGVVKVQKSSDHTGGFSNSPAITISPQFQAILISKTSPGFSSNTGQSNTVSTTYGSTTERPSINQDVSKSLSPTKCQRLTGLSGFTSSKPGKLLTAVSCPVAVGKNPPISSTITSSSLKTADVICKSPTHGSNGSNIAKLFLVSPSSSQDANVSCSKTLPTSVMLVNQQSPTAKSLIPIHCVNTVLKPAATTGALQPVMESPSAPSRTGIYTSSINSVSAPKNKGLCVASGTSPDPIHFPSLITTTIPQSTEQLVTTTTTTQSVFTNSSIISSVPAPATSLSNLKHLGISSITVNSQPGTIPCPSTKCLQVEDSKKKQGFSSMLSSNSKVHSAISPGTCLKRLFMPNASGPQDSFQVPQITTSSATSLTSSAQQQMVINTSTHLAGGTRIVLNNAHFVVPPQGLAPGSHVLIFSGHTQKVPSLKSKMPVPFQEPGQALLQPKIRLPSVPAIGSPFVANSVQSTSPIISAPRLSGPSNAMLVNKIPVAKPPFVQTANTGRPAEGTFTVSTFPSLVPLVSTVLTNATTTTTASLGLPLPHVLPPLSSTVLIQPFTTDPPLPLQVGTTRTTKGLSSKSLAQSPSQHPPTKVTSITSSTSAALLHMGLGSLQVQKPEESVGHPVSTIAQASSGLSTQKFPPVVSSGTQTLLSSSGGVVKAVETSPLSINSTALPHGKKTTHCPVIVTNPAMEKHLLQTAFLEAQSPVPSKLLISPDGAVLSAVQSKAESTLPKKTS